MPRSYLFVPGTRSDRFEKALRSGADAVIFDLEDSVVPSEKPGARRIVGDFLREQGNGEGDKGRHIERWVRTNPGPQGLDDVRAVVCRQLDGVCPAKTNSLGYLRELDVLLQEAASAAAIEPLLEDAKAVLSAAEIAAGPRVRRLHVGEGDLAADLGLAPGDGNVGLGGARTMVVLVSAAAEIESPVAPVSVEYRDLDGFADDTRYLRRLGFWGRVCIHPKQIDIVNDIFTVSAAEVDWANDVLRRLGEAEHASAELGWQLMPMGA